MLRSVGRSRRERLTSGNMAGSWPVAKMKHYIEVATEKSRPGFPERLLGEQYRANEFLTWPGLLPSRPGKPGVLSTLPWLQKSRGLPLRGFDSRGR